jgi:oxygen-dependent protoporphyrinogen oxidase
MTRILNMYLQNCIPQYYVGHSKTISSTDNYIDDNNLPVSLVGWSYKGVSFNDCTLSAKTEMKKIRNKLLPQVHKETTEEMKTNG